VIQAILSEPYSSRPARVEDAGNIHSVISAYDVYIAGYSDFALGDLMGFTTAPGFDWNADSLVVERDGEIVGASMVWGRGEPPRYSSFGVTHPDHLDRGIGACLVEFQDRRAQEIANATDGVTLRPWVDLADRPGLGLYGERGFTETRRHYSMLADLPGLDLSTDAPKNIEIRACTERDLRAVHWLLEETFREHWGFSEEPFERWHAGAYAREDTDLDLWFVAVGEGGPVGVVIGRPKKDLGWVDDLGVVKAWRRKGVGGALLRRSFASFRERGFPQVGLSVDASNETGAVALYEGVGMRAARVYVALEKTYGI
jgi:mycothiol synthase